MADPRLNSVHLEGGRREQFRLAREKLLRARGWQTLLVEQQGELAASPSPQTLIQNNHTVAPAHVQFWLVDKDYIYPLKIGLNTVGRSSDNDVVINDGYVSRRHCAILVHSGAGCDLHDTASKNGTYLNGTRLTGPSRLKAGDEVRMCDRTLIFMTHDAILGEDPSGPPPTRTIAD